MSYWTLCLVSVLISSVVSVALLATKPDSNVKNINFCDNIRNGLQGTNHLFEIGMIVALGFFLLIEMSSFIFLKISHLKVTAMAPRLILIVGLASSKIALYQQLESEKLCLIYTGLYVFRYVLSVGCVSSLIFIHYEDRSRLYCHIFLCNSFALLHQLLVSAAALSEHHGYEIAATVCWLGALFEMLIIFISWQQISFGKPNKQTRQPDLALGSYIFLLLANILVCVSIINSNGFTFTAIRIASSEEVRLENAIQTTFIVAIVIIPAILSTMQDCQRLEQALDEQGTFMRYMSHEMRTPLNIMNLSLGFVETEAGVLKTLVDGKIVAPILDAISDIKSSCHTATSILDDFLTLDKMHGGKMTVELLDVDPQKFLWETFRQFTLIAQQSQINFKFICEESEIGWCREVCLRLDTMKFAQVMRNLLSNAFKFTPVRGTVTLRVSRVPLSPALRDRDRGTPGGDGETSISLRRMASNNEPVNSFRSKRSSSVSPIVEDRIMGHNFLIEVVDSGAGISLANQEKLFGQYVQFNASKLQKGGGSGLGLWISRGITELHGGLLWAESEGEGLGSTFKVELPMFPKVDSNPPSPHISTHAAGDEADSHGLRERAASSDYSLDSNGDRKIKLSGSNSRHSGSSGSKSFIEEAGFLEVRRVSSASRSSSSIKSRTSVLAAAASRQSASIQSSQYDTMRHYANAAIRLVHSSHSDVPAGIPIPIPITPVSEGACESETFFARSRASSSSISERRINSDLDLALLMDQTTCEANLGDASFNTVADTDASFVSISATNFEDAAQLFGKSETDEKPSGKADSLNNSPKKGAGGAGKSSAEKGIAAGSSPPSRWSQGLRIMIVDDSTPSRKVLRRMIARHGHKVFEAKGGTELLQKVEAPLSTVCEDSEGDQRAALAGGAQPHSTSKQGLKFDIILMDHHMPKMNGPETTRRLRERGYAGLIVGMAGLTLKSDVDFFKSRGADHVLRKPVDINELKAIAERDLNEPSGSAGARTRKGPDVSLGGKDTEVSNARRDATFPAKYGGYEPANNSESGQRKRAAKNAAVDLQSELEDFRRSVEGDSRPSPRKLLCWDTGLRVLIVDDSISNRKVLKRMLLSKEHTVTDAVDGQQCLTIVETALLSQLGSDKPDSPREAQPVQGSWARLPQEVFDVILMDWHMPNMNGPEAVKELRARGYKGLIIGITGDTEELDMAFFRSQGANVVLSKPIRVDDLKAAVDTYGKEAA